MILEDIIKEFPEAHYTEGSGKFGTTAAKLLSHEKFQVMDSPRYKGLQFWLRQEGETSMQKFKPKNLLDLHNAIANLRI